MRNGLEHQKSQPESKAVPIARESEELALLSERFRDFDELSSRVSDWGFDFKQLNAGPSEATLTQLTSPAISLQRFELGCTYHQRGASPSRARSFGFLEDGVHGVRMCGSEFSANDLMGFRPGGEFDAVTRPGFAGWTISIDEERLARAIEGVAPHARDIDVMEQGLREVDRGALDRLRRRSRKLIARLEGDPASFHSRDFAEELEGQLPLDLAEVLVSARGRARAPQRRPRNLALRRALEIIRARGDYLVTVRDLCDELGISQTTLVKAFREQFGVAPKAYLRADRLNDVRRSLLEATPETVIADVANRWGFWHMGQFAADYRRLFGELPSETRQR
jgi:AraC-like DNA-binding protein